jgi:3-deoxy-D-manno-octulosonate 8-phosphate phosphatase KdsC-like HAD superfamily phosphatase
MKYLALIITAMLVGCSTAVPIKTAFPEAPQILKEKCENLKKIEGDKVAITEMLKVVIHNYTLYYECSTKVDGWQEWYNEQKKIYESVK